MSTRDVAPKVTAAGAANRPCADGCGRIREPGVAYCTTCRSRRRKKKVT